MNDYQTIDKPGGYKKPQKKNKELGLEFDQKSGGKITRKNRNTTRMVNNIVSTVEVKITEQTIDLNSTSSSKGKCMTK